MKKKKNVHVYIIFVNYFNIYTSIMSIVLLQMMTSHVDVCKIICFSQIYCQIYHVREFKYMLLLLFYII